MIYKKATRNAGTQDTNTVDYEDAQHKPLRKKRQAWKGVMGGYKLEISIASTMVILPMLALSAVLVALVYPY